jgi:ketosteroid isomerase-like protein
MPVVEIGLPLAAGCCFARGATLAAPDFSWSLGDTSQAMLPDHVQVALNAIQAWNRQDLVAFLEGWHPECEWRPAFPKGTQGSGMVFRGHEGVTQAWHGVREAWEEYRLEVEDSRMVGEDLAVLGHIYIRGAGSGVELDSPWSAVVRFRDGKVVSAWDWLDHVSALEAVGLSGQDAQGDLP